MGTRPSVARVGIGLARPKGGANLNPEKGETTDEGLTGGRTVISGIRVWSSVSGFCDYRKILPCPALCPLPSGPHEARPGHPGRPRGPALGPCQYFVRILPGSLSGPAPFCEACQYFVRILPGSPRRAPAFRPGCGGGDAAGVGGVTE